MRIEELRPGARVVWSCLGDPDDWKGTRLTWEMSAEDGGTMLRFTHGNWRSTEGYFGICNSTWGELMYRLKDHVEGKRSRSPVDEVDGEGGAMPKMIRQTVTIKASPHAVYEALMDSRKHAAFSGMPAPSAASPAAGSRPA